LSLTGGDEDGESLVGMNVTIPLYVRNRFSHEVTAALAERSQAQRLADDVMQRAHARLVSAAERYELSRGAWGDWASTGQASLTRQTEQLKRLWQAGDLREALWRAWFEWLWASGQVDAWLGKGAYQ